MFDVVVEAGVIGIRKGLGGSYEETPVRFLPHRRRLRVPIRECRVAHPGAAIG